MRIRNQRIVSFTLAMILILTYPIQTMASIQNTNPSKEKTITFEGNLLGELVVEPLYINDELYASSDYFQEIGGTIELLESSALKLTYGDDTLIVTPNTPISLYNGKEYDLLSPILDKSSFIEYFEFIEDTDTLEMYSNIDDNTILLPIIPVTRLFDFTITDSVNNINIEKNIDTTANDIDTEILDNETDTNIQTPSSDIATTKQFQPISVDYTDYVVDSQSILQYTFNSNSPVTIIENKSNLSTTYTIENANLESAAWFQSSKIGVRDTARLSQNGTSVVLQFNGTTDYNSSIEYIDNSAIVTISQKDLNTLAKLNISDIAYLKDDNGNYDQLTINSDKNVEYDYVKVSPTQIKITGYDANFIATENEIVLDNNIIYSYSTENIGSNAVLYINTNSEYFSTDILNQGTTSKIIVRNSIAQINVVNHLYNSNYTMNDIFISTSEPVSVTYKQFSDTELVFYIPNSNFITSNKLSNVNKGVIQSFETVNNGADAELHVTTKLPDYSVGIYYEGDIVKLRLAGGIAPIEDNGYIYDPETNTTTIITDSIRPVTYSYKQFSNTQIRLTANNANFIQNNKIISTPDSSIINYQLVNAYDNAVIIVNTPALNLNPYTVSVIYDEGRAYIKIQDAIRFHGIPTNPETNITSIQTVSSFDPAFKYTKISPTQFKLVAENTRFTKETSETNLSNRPGMLSYQTVNENGNAVIYIKTTENPYEINISYNPNNNVSSIKFIPMLKISNYNYDPITKISTLAITGDIPVKFRYSRKDATRVDYITDNARIAPTNVTVNDNALVSYSSFNTPNENSATVSFNTLPYNGWHKYRFNLQYDGNTTYIRFQTLLDFRGVSTTADTTEFVITSIFDPAFEFVKISNTEGKFVSKNNLFFNTTDFVPYNKNGIKSYKVTNEGNDAVIYINTVDDNLTGAIEYSGSRTLLRVSPEQPDVVNLEITDYIYDDTTKTSTLTITGNAPIKLIPSQVDSTTVNFIANGANIVNDNVTVNNNALVSYSSFNTNGGNTANISLKTLPFEGWHKYKYNISYSGNTSYIEFQTLLDFRGVSTTSDTTEFVITSIFDPAFQFTKISNTQGKFTAKNTSFYNTTSVIPYNKNGIKSYQITNEGNNAVVYINTVDDNLTGAIEYSGSRTLLRISPLKDPIYYDATTGKYVIDKSGIGIPSLTISDISIVDNYHINQLIIDFNKKATVDVPMAWPADPRIKSFVLTDKNGSNTSRLVFNEALVSAPILSEDANNIYIKMVKPSDKYNKIVVLDPGHGGTDSGATEGNNYEKNIVMAVSNRTLNYLNSKQPNIKVYLTRRTDIFIELIDRAIFATEIGANEFVSIHANKYSNPDVSGIETFHHTTNNTTTSGVGKNYNAVQLANKVQDELITKTGAKNRGVKSANFSVLRNSTMPAVLVELGFISNPNELNNLINPTYQSKLAQAIGDAIIYSME